MPKTTVRLPGVPNPTHRPPTVRLCETPLSAKPQRLTLGSLECQLEDDRDTFWAQILKCPTSETSVRLPTVPNPKDCRHISKTCPLVWRFQFQIYLPPSFGDATSSSILIAAPRLAHSGSR